MILNEYLTKLRKVLETRRKLFVIARTDASEPDEVLKRVEAFADAGANAVLADGLKDLGLLKAMREKVKCPIAFNQIAGGKSPACSHQQLADQGVSIVIYSTPCLFPAQAAMENAMGKLKEKDGLLSADLGVDVRSCTAVLQENLERRNQR